MSWVLGTINNYNDLTEHNKITKNNPIYSIYEPPISIYVGGNSNTCYLNHNIDTKKGWAVVGVGIIEDSNGFKLMDKYSWKDILEENSFNTNEIFGHYIIIRWDARNLHITTDRLGLRDIYISKLHNKILFSTRLDWLARFIDTEIDFKVFGSRWLLFNQISSDSVLTKATRISGGESVTIDLKNLQWVLRKDDFIPIMKSGNTHNPIEDFSCRLDKIIQVPFNSNNNLSLSLSGGMDSRVLLSSLLKNAKMNLWDTHTFGNNNHPDSIISNKIADQFKFTHKNINRDMPSVEDCVNELIDYCGQTIVNNSASAILQLNNYQLLRNWNDKTIVDGGFGEIWRREFFNRLFIKGKSALVNREYENVLVHLKLPRADIFTEDINNLMHVGCKEQLENIFEELPSMQELDVENWLDLFAIKTRLLNYYSHEQARLDSIIKSYMPFIQIPLLNNLFTTPIEIRKNAKLYRHIIKNNYSPLSKFWLAKGSTSHPFPLTMIQSRLWNMLSKKLNLNQYNDNSTIIFLKYLNEYINDIMRSKSLQECGFYDHKKIKMMLDNFNSNPHLLAHNLDWLLSFEIFRKTIFDK